MLSLPEPAGSSLCSVQAVFLLCSQRLVLTYICGILPDIERYFKVPTVLPVKKVPGKLDLRLERQSSFILESM